MSQPSVQMAYRATTTICHQVGLPLEHLDLHGSCPGLSASTSKIATRVSERKAEDDEQGRDGHLSPECTELAASKTHPTIKMSLFQSITWLIRSLQ
jgi:hypothetical protein